MRARINSVYITMFVGMMPLGNALFGIVAEHTSAMFAVRAGAVAILLVTAIFYFRGVFANLSKTD